MNSGDNVDIPGTDQLYFLSSFRLKLISRLLGNRYVFQHVRAPDFAAVEHSFCSSTVKTVFSYVWRRATVADSVCPTSSVGMGKLCCQN